MILFIQSTDSHRDIQHCVARGRP